MCMLLLKYVYKGEVELWLWVFFSELTETPVLCSLCDQHPAVCLGGQSAVFQFSVTYK